MLVAFGLFFITLVIVLTTIILLNIKHKNDIEDNENKYDVILKKIITNLEDHVHDKDAHFEKNQKERLNRGLMKMNRHINDDDIHFDDTLQSKFESLESSVDALSTDLTSHVSNQDIHFVEDDRQSFNESLSNMNTHMANSYIHMNETEKEEIMNHMSDTNKHFIISETDGNEKDAVTSILASSYMHMTDMESHFDKEVEGEQLPIGAYTKSRLGTLNNAFITHKTDQNVHFIDTETNGQKLSWSNQLFP